jgi:hypothetical protein
MSIQTKDGKLDPAIQSETDKTIKRVFESFWKATNRFWIFR